MTRTRGVLALFVGSLLMGLVDASCSHGTGGGFVDAGPEGSAGDGQGGVLGGRGGSTNTGGSSFTGGAGGTGGAAAGGSGGSSCTDVCTIDDDCPWPVQCICNTCAASFGPARKCLAGCCLELENCCDFACSSG
jgi:hypothetical protein